MSHIHNSNIYFVALLQNLHVHVDFPTKESEQCCYCRGHVLSHDIALFAIFITFVTVGKWQPRLPTFCGAIS